MGQHMLGISQPFRHVCIGATVNDLDDGARGMGADSGVGGCSVRCVEPWVLSVALTAETRVDTLASEEDSFAAGGNNGV